MLLDGLLDQDRDVVLAARVAADRDLRRVGTLRQWPRPADVQGLRHLRQPHLTVPVGEAVREVRGGVLRLAVLLERRVAGLLAPKRDERALYVPQRRLRRTLGRRGE